MKKIFFLTMFFAVPALAQDLSKGRLRIVTCDVWVYSSEARTWGCRSIPREILVATPEKIEALEKEIQDLKALIRNKP